MNKQNILYALSKLKKSLNTTRSLAQCSNERQSVDNITCDMDLLETIIDEIDQKGVCNG